MLYKVVKEEGVVVDGVDFALGEVFDLEADAFNVSELLAEGAIVESSEEDVDGSEVEVPDEGALPGEDAPVEEDEAPAATHTDVN